MFALLPWFMGKLFAGLSVGRRLIVSLSERTAFQRIFPSQAQRPSVGRRVFSFLLGSVPEFLTLIACLYAVQRAASHEKDFLVPYLLIAALFSLLFFLSVVWSRASGRSDTPPQ